MLTIRQPRTGIAIISAGSVIDRQDLPVLRRALENLEDDGIRQLVIDLSATSHIYYRTADLLAAVAGRLSRRHGSLQLAGMNHYVSSIFSAVGYPMTFDCFDSPRQALEQM